MLIYLLSRLFAAGIISCDTRCYNLRVKKAQQYVRVSFTSPQLRKASWF